MSTHHLAHQKRLFREHALHPHNPTPPGSQPRGLQLRRGPLSRSRDGSTESGVESASKNKPRRDAVLGRRAAEGERAGLGSASGSQGLGHGQLRARRADGPNPHRARQRRPRCGPTTGPRPPPLPALTFLLPAVGRHRSPRVAAAARMRLTQAPRPRQQPRGPVRQPVLRAAPALPRLPLLASPPPARFSPSSLRPFPPLGLRRPGPNLPAGAQRRAGVGGGQGNRWRRRAALKWSLLPA